MKNSGFYDCVKAVTIFFIGSMAYGMMEVAVRGFSHISMGFLGGISFMFISFLNIKRRQGEISLVPQMLLITVFITAAEFVAGLILNVWLDMGIWTYEGVPLNVYGQICIPFIAIWFVLSFVGIATEELVRTKIFKENIVPLISFKKNTNADVSAS